MNSVQLFSLADVLKNAEDINNSRQQREIRSQAMLAQERAGRQQQSLDQILGQSFVTQPPQTIPNISQDAYAAGQMGPAGPDTVIPGKTSFDFNKAYAAASRMPGDIKGQALLAIQKQQQDQEDRRFKMSMDANKAKSESDYQDIKITEDGRLIGRRKGTGQFEYMELPENARASQPPVMFDTGMGVAPMTRSAALNIAHSGGVVPRQQQIPTPALNALRENDLNLKKVNDVLDATDPNITPDRARKLAERGIKYDPKAFGVKTLTPNLILNRVDPTGTDARAISADLGSMVIHDRSGAAVTASEIPRLNPFIPRGGDDPITVRKKLQGFKRVYDQIQSEMRSDYSPERGFIPINTPAPQAPSNQADDYAAKRKMILGR